MTSTDDERREIVLNFFKATKFILSIIYEIATATLIVLGIKTMEAIITPDMKFIGWPVHDIALVLETFTLLGFFVSSVINHFGHMFHRQFGWFRKLFES